MRSRKITRSLAVSISISILTLATVAGCALLEQFLVPPAPPTARIESVRMTDLSFEYVELTADITLSNPNSFSLELARLSYAVDVNEARPVSGRARQAITLAPEGDAQTSVSVRLRYADIVQMVSGLSEVSETPYRLELEPGFDVPVLGAVDIPLVWEGTIPVLRMPRVRFSGAALESVSILGAQLSIGFEIDNPNSVRLIPDDISFAFSLSGISIADGQIDNPAPVAAGSSEQRSILVDLRFLEAGEAVRRILTNRGNIPYTFVGELAFGIDLPFVPLTRLPFELSGSTSLR